MEIYKLLEKDAINYIREAFNQTAKTLTCGFVNLLIDMILPVAN